MKHISTLAILGGRPIINREFRRYSTIDETDRDAVLRVLNSGSLSKFIGDAGQFFLGGTEVQNFEKIFSELFSVNYSVSVNSWTSGLWSAIGALDLEPGSEIITSPWTMAATATTILHWNLIPVFADINRQTFNLDPADVQSRISSRTRAIVSPDIFGQSADIETLLKICEKYGLYLVSDSAQSPMAKRNGYLAGTKSHIAGFSFNYHKHIHTGEGGMLITDNPTLADRMRLLRNHGEVAIARRGSSTPMYGILGMNMRLGEMEAAIGSNQLGKLSIAVESRQLAALRFFNGTAELPGLAHPKIDSGNSHVYYVYGITLDEKILGVPRDKIFEALKAEGVPGLMLGYQNLHKLPLFRQQLTYRSNPLPYSLLPKKRAAELREQSLPIAEELHDCSFIGINWCAYELTEEEVDAVIEAFHKVWANLASLRA